MSSSRLVRGAKTRMFAFVCLVSVLGAVLYVFHGTQARLAEVQSQATQCNQQKEAFNAQLQVIYEYKDRLEKSLNKEKQERKSDAENHEGELAEAKEKKVKEMTEWNNKYEALVQKSKMLQAQLEDLKESSDKAMTKIQNEKTDLENVLSETKKQLDDSEARFKDDTAGLKTKFIEQKEELRSCRSDLDDCKMRSAPAAEQKDYLTKQNDQLKAEVDMAKHELAQCKDKLSQTPRPPLAGSKVIDQPDTNVVDMPKLMGFKNISVTPNINPDAVGESSSLKPAKEQGEQKKEEDHVGLAPKKPTQESIIPLAQPKKFDDNPPPNGQAQIPGPPDSNPQLDTLNRPAAEDTNELSNIVEENADDPVHQAEAKAQIQLPQFNGAPDANRGEEEDEQQQVAQPQPGRNPDHYHGGDYDKEQAEDEDDEAEQIDYDGDRSLKDGRQKMKIVRRPAGKMERHGVMVNPK
ncbi:Hypothetical protein NTJ_15122 [Nesidiocoris tenuis]|uniref:Golgi integral membrane protein 4 n=1 Tax=Nesidiocoris tenuis TaxID=355587 RepID=A0ABN7BDC4_9HEMI|nr:Hypothetical protein NTJ_15122 [Nesidiocoris tenuis]